RRLLAQATPADVEALSALGIDSIYAPVADPELTRRIDAAPHPAPAGGARRGSRVWTVSLDPKIERATAPAWHRPLIAGLLGLWLVAIVLTAPRRRREEPEPLEDEEVAA